MTWHCCPDANVCPAQPSETMVSSVALRPETDDALTSMGLGPGFITTTGTVMGEPLAGTSGHQNWLGPTTSGPLGGGVWNLISPSSGCELPSQNCSKSIQKP